MKINNIYNYINNIFNPKTLQIKSTKNIDDDFRRYNKDFLNIADYLPYRRYSKEKDLYFNTNSCGFIIELNALIGSNESTSDVLTQMITAGLPEGCIVSFLNWASPNVEPLLDFWCEPRLNKIDTLSKLARKRKEFFMNGSKHSLFDMYPYTVKNFRCFMVVSMEVNKKYTMDYVIQKLSYFKNSLFGMLSSIRLVNSKEIFPPIKLINFLNEIINPIKDSHYSTLSYNYLEDINKQISNNENSIKLDVDKLTFEKDKIVAKTFSVKEYPREFSQYLCTELIGSRKDDNFRMTCPFLTCFSFYLENEEEESKKMMVKSMRIAQKCETPMLKYDKDLPLQKQEMDFVMEKVRRDQKIVKSFYSVTIFDTEDNIQNSEDKIKMIYKNNGWTLQSDMYIQLLSFLGILPFNLAEGFKTYFKEVNKFSTMISWTCANLLPLQGEWYGFDSPCMLLCGRRGQICFWDPFKNPGGNYNVAIVGESGGGKSVLTQDLISSLRAIDTRVIYIDDGKSCMSLCHLLGGEHILFSDETKINGKGLCINMFSLIDEKIYEENNEYKSDVQELLTNIIVCMCLGKEEATSIQRSFIKKAIMKVWGEKRSNATITDIRDYLETVNDNRAKDLAICLTPYVISHDGQLGQYANYFHGECNVNIDNNDFVVFEMAELKSRPDLLRIVLLIIMFLVSQKMYFSGKRDKKLAFVIDEAWTFLDGSSEIGHFIEGFVRRCRKYYGALITATQSILDYLKNPGARAALENSSNVICLQGTKINDLVEAKVILPDKNEMEIVKEALQSLRMVKGCYSEALITDRKNHNIVRLVEDPYSLSILSSAPEDFDRINRLQKEFGFTLVDAADISTGYIKLNKLLKNKHENTISLDNFVYQLKNINISDESFDAEYRVQQILELYYA